jgi:hypothetical protein
MPAPAPETLPTVLFWLHGQVATPAETAAIAALPARVLVRWDAFSPFPTVWPEAADGVAALDEADIPAAYDAYPRVALPVEA